MIKGLSSATNRSGHVLQCRALGMSDKQSLLMLTMLSFRPQTYAKMHYL